MTYISRSWLQIHAWTQLILHPQRQPSGRSSGQQDAPGTTERKEGLPWTCSCFCFYPSSSFWDYPQSLLFLQSVPSPVLRSSSPERHGRDQGLRGWLGEQGRPYFTPQLWGLALLLHSSGSFSAMGLICNNAVSTVPVSSVNQSITPHP